MENGYEYIVKEGDTLSEILYDLTGSANKDIYEKIAADNNIGNVEHIIPGQKIVIGPEYLGSSSSNSSSNTGSGGETKNVETNNDDSLIFESDDQSDLEQFLSKNESQEKKSEEINPQKKEASNNQQNLTPQEKVPANTSQQNEDNNTKSNGTNNVSNTVYTPSDYEICYPQSVSGFEPRNFFKTFQIKENAGERFVAVNNQVRKCGTDIDGIITSLTTLKTKMGENTGTTTQIDKITNALKQKKEDLITKNSELIKACDQVIDYVYANKSSKAEEASKVYNTISNIDIYKG